MKVLMIALATVATVSAAAPAFATPSKYDRYAEQQREEQQREEQPSIYAGMSWHCQQVMARPDMAGDRQVSYCRENLF
jgi:hypothetical protein